MTSVLGFLASINLAMHPYTVVEIIMISFAVIYLLLEIALNLNDIDHDTSNVILLEWSQDKLFFIPFALGAIGGHLFLGTTNPAFKLANSMYPVFILVGICLICLIIGFKVSFNKTRWFLSLMLALGIAYGHYFWSMNYQHV